MAVTMEEKQQAADHFEITIAELESGSRCVVDRTKLTMTANIPGIGEIEKTLEEEIVDILAELGYEIEEE